MTSRTLAEEAKRRKLAVEDEEGYTDANELEELDEQVDRKFCLSRRHLWWMSFAWILSLIISLAVFIYGSAESWNCDGNCDAIETWIGNAGDYVTLYICALVLKFIVIVVFFAALLRIKRTADKLID